MQKPIDNLDTLVKYVASSQEYPETVTKSKAKNWYTLNVDAMIELMH